MNIENIFSFLNSFVQVPISCLPVAYFVIKMLSQHLKPKEKAIKTSPIHSFCQHHHTKKLLLQQVSFSHPHTIGFKVTICRTTSHRKYVSNEITSQSSAHSKTALKACFIGKFDLEFSNS